MPISSSSSTVSSGAIVRALWPVAVAALVGAIALMLGVRSRPAAIVRSVENGGDWYARSPGWYTTRGLYPTEHAPDGAPFAWAGGRVRLQIAQLDRRAPRDLRLRVRSGRDDQAPAAAIRVAVDGLEGRPATVGSEWQEIAIALPAARGHGATITLDAQATFVPGPQDPRALAFMVDRVTLDPGGERLTPSAETLIAVAAFAGGVALAAACCLVPPWIACLAGIAAGAAVTVLLLFDAAFLGAYASRLTPLPIGVVAASALASLAASRASAEMRPGWRAAAFIAIAVTAIKLAVFLHPDSPIGDGMFHVHRAQAVRAGQYLLTSVTPRPFYEFPYPIGLYLAAQPFWGAFPDRVMLLRGVTFVADALVALALFAAVAVRWGVATGIAATALAVAVPVITQSISTANLTNVFGQSCFSLAIAWIGWNLSGRHALAGAAGAVVLLSAAYLSHFSTAVIGIPAAVAIAIAVACARDRDEARQWRWIAAAVAAAVVLSYVDLLRAVPRGLRPDLVARRAGGRRHLVRRHARRAFREQSGDALAFPAGQLRVERAHARRDWDRHGGAPWLARRMDARPRRSRDRLRRLSAARRVHADRDARQPRRAPDRRLLRRARLQVALDDQSDSPARVRRADGRDDDLAGRGGATRGAGFRVGRQRLAHS